MTVIGTFNLLLLVSIEGGRLVTDLERGIKKRKIAKSLSECRYSDLKEVFDLGEKFKSLSPKGKRKTLVKILNLLENKSIYIESKIAMMSYLNSETSLEEDIYSKLIEAYKAEKGEGVKNLICRLASNNRKSDKNINIPSAETPEVQDLSNRVLVGHETYTH